MSVLGAYGLFRLNQQIHAGKAKAEEAVHGTGFSILVSKFSKMKRIPRASGTRLLLLSILLCAGLALSGYLTYRTKSLPLLDAHLVTPRPPVSLQPSRFPCLDSLANGKSKKRVVVLHGPDYTLESTVELKCFPEREVVLSVELDRQFLPQPARKHIRFWIVKKSDIVHVKIVESSGDEKVDMDTLYLASNHHCGPKNAKNCRIQSARIVAYM
jgi:hypothetical protein